MLTSKMKFQSRSKVYKTGLVVFTVVCFLLFSNQSIAQSKVMDVETFDKIVVSPHIEVIFRKGKKESVSVMSITVPIEKLNIDVKKNTLNLFLDGTKIIANTKKEYVNGYKTKTSIYKGTVARVIITYKNLNSLDLRGEERFEFESYINSKKLRLQIYGESQVYFNEVAINSLLVSIYGESYLEIKQGKIENQKFTAYGESKVNTMNVESKETKLTAYGDGTFQFNVSEKLKITSYGEATIKYSGSPTLNKGIIIGETKITNIE